MKVRYTNDEVESSATCSNFEAQIIAEMKRQSDIRKQLTEKQAVLEQIEEELPLYVLQYKPEKVDGPFCKMAHERFKLRAEIQEKVCKYHINIFFFFSCICSSLVMVFQNM